MLTAIFKGVLFLSLAGSAFALIFIAVSPLTLHLFGISWRYYSWLIILFIMITPISLRAFHSNSDSAVTTVGQTDALSQQYESAENLMEENIPNQAETAGGMPEFAAGADIRDRIPVNIYRLASLIWVGGVIIFIILTLISYAIFLRRIRQNSMPLQNTAAEKTAKELGIKRTFRILSTSLSCAPLMTGLFRPALLIPRYEQDSQELEYVFLHELTHFKRRDLLYKWFSMLVCAVHWFNPIVYIIIKIINRDCEISCDFSACAALDENQKKEYMQTILKTISAKSKF